MVAGWGATWSTSGQGFTAAIQGVAFDPTDSQRVYARFAEWQRILQGTDGGLTWSPRSFGSSAVYVISVAVDAEPPTVVTLELKRRVFQEYGPRGYVGLRRNRAVGAITYLTVDPTEGGRLFASNAPHSYVRGWRSNLDNVLNSPAGPSL